MEDVNSWLRGIHKFHKNWATTKSTDSTVIFQALLYHFNATLKRGITQLLYWKKYWLCSFKILAVKIRYTLSHYILVWKRLIFWPYSLNLTSSMARSIHQMTRTFAVSSHTSSGWSSKNCWLSSYRRSIPNFLASALCFSTNSACKLFN